MSKIFYVFVMSILFLQTPFKLFAGEGQEDIIGTWSGFSGATLVVKTFGGKNWLLQTDKDKNYYTVRGSNFLSAPGVSISPGIQLSSLNLVNQNTGNGGLSSPSVQPTDDLARFGYVKNAEGDYTVNAVLIKDLPAYKAGGTTPPDDTKLVIDFYKLTDGQEVKVAQWNVVPDSYVVVKKIDGKFWLLQTTKDNKYYVVRGKNHLDDNRVKLETGLNKADIQKLLANDVTELGGLMPTASKTLTAANFPLAWFEQKLSYKKNEWGELTKDGGDPLNNKATVKTTDKTVLTTPIADLYVKPENALSNPVLAIEKSLKVSGEKIIGTWSVTNPDGNAAKSFTDIVVVKEVNGRTWLLQTTPNRAYYVIRAKNFVYNDHKEVNIAPASRLIDLKEEVKGVSNPIAKEGDYGLQFSYDPNQKYPPNWDEKWWTDNGFEKVEGELRKKK